ncbi:thioredoxin domain-containing protein [Schlesneria paludicola]|uniref:thioredoxin domain-containing protein n=1 Tax=Schlesneria paludicola TaxID=360056 RepID=UPI0002DE576E|nr:thioredoxin domain-containing protein [Schlesneria paludicola]
MQDRVPNSPDTLSRLTATSSGTDRNFSQSAHDRRSHATNGSRSRSPLGFWNGLFLCGTFLFAIAGGMMVTTTISAQAIDQNNILLDFSATWCGPCQQMSPLVSKLEREGLPIRKVDIDREAELARQYNVTSIPCFVLVSNGRELNRIVGPTSEKNLRQMMTMLQKSRNDDSTAKPSRTGGQLISTADAGKSATKEKKQTPKLPSLFAKNPETKLTPTDGQDTIRGQNPGEGLVATGLVELPMAASTRIRVTDGSRVHFGSGTIIDAQDDHAVILTCGHIFRKLGKDAVIEVNYYVDGQSHPKTAIGTILKFDPSGADLGLLEIPCSERLTSIKLGFAHSPLSVDDRVISIGCGRGDPPSVQQHSITAINRYDGPDNIECNGIPQLGRSGGGLFRGAEIVGVCIAADPKDQRGIYTGLKPVAELLGRCKLDHLLPSIPGSDRGGALVEATPPPSAPDFNSANNALATANQQRLDEEVVSLLNEASRSGGTANSSISDYVGAEVVCIIRPRTPGAMSRIVIVNEATERFTHDLLHESDSRSKSAPVDTAQKAPRKKSATHRSNGLAANDTQMDLQKPNMTNAAAKEAHRTVETSFEPQRYRRKRD